MPGILPHTVHESYNPAFLDNRRKHTCGGKTSSGTRQRSGAHADRRGVSRNHSTIDLGKGLVRAVGFRTPDLLLAWSPIYGEAALEALVVNVSTWTIAAEFRMGNDVGYPIEENLNLAPDLRVTGQRIFAGGYGQYVLRELDWNGELLREVERDSDLVAAPRTSQPKAASAGTGYVWAPIALAGGYWITTGRWVTNKDELEGIYGRERSGPARRNLIHSAYFLDVLEADGTLAGSLVWERNRPSWAFFDVRDSAGNVYSKVTDPFPQVRRYRIERLGR